MQHWVIEQFAGQRADQTEVGHVDDGAGGLRGGEAALLGVARRSRLGFAAPMPASTHHVRVDALSFVSAVARLGTLPSVNRAGPWPVLEAASPLWCRCWTRRAGWRRWR